MSDRMILGKNISCSMNCRETGLNNNVLVIGASGSGKSRGLVSPNLLEASGSYLVSDPKGALYRKYGDYLRSRGYQVRKLDFTAPADSCRYNPFHYIHTTQDVVKLAHMLAYHDKGSARIDPFWEESSQLLLQACIAYLIAEMPQSEQNIGGILYLLDKLSEGEGFEERTTELDRMFAEMHSRGGEMGLFARRCYNQVRVACEKTLSNIVVSTNARMVPLLSREVRQLTAWDETNITRLGQRKTALFVVNSDTDRSLDSLVNLFFTQAMQELCHYADHFCQDQQLPVPVRFVMDDFACGCAIEDFPRMIASIRSRGISAMLMIQAESQIYDLYGIGGGKTIISNCDTIVFLGTNDVETAASVAKRCNLPLKRVLYMPVGRSWIFRRGREPVCGENIRLEEYPIPQPELGMEIGA